MRLLCLLLLVLVPALPVAAIARFEGTLPDGLGRYAIDVPADWRPGDTLLVYSHGFSMRFPAQVEHINTAPNGPLRNDFLSRGLALAAATYADRGWAMFDIERVQHALLDEVRRVAGEPGAIILFGGSLGGLVSLRTAEAYAAGGAPVAGVYAACPPLAGARTWDLAVDTRLLFDAVCPDNPLPTGSATLPWVIDHAAIPPNLSDLTDGSTLQSALPIANRIRQCLGFYQPAFLDTQGQLQRRARLKALLGIGSDDFLLTQIAYAVYPLADLIQSPTKLGGGNAFDNRFVDYGDAEINARIRRVERDPLAAARLRGVSDLRGPFGTARVLLIHGDRDELVLPEHLALFDGFAHPAERSALALVRQSAVAHCDFSEAELLAGFDGLLDWIDGAAKPDAASLRAACEARRGSDTAQRCGFDPTLAVGDFDVRTRPRQLDVRPIAGFHSGAWFDSRFDGEGLLLEVIEGTRDAIVGWYTYPPAGASGEQRWIAGLGRISEDGIHVAEAFEYRGARFGDFDPARITATAWGELTLAFGGCDAPPPAGDSLPPGVLRLRYAGPDAYGAGERQLLQLTQNASARPLCQQVGIPPQPVPASALSGSWFRSGAPGDGWVVQVGADDETVVGWYTFDPQGEPAWLVGRARFDPANRSLRLRMTRTRGARFGNAFDADAVERIDWGELRLDFDGCDQAVAAWQPEEPGWTPGGAALVRLTRVAGSPACVPPAALR